MNNAQYNSYLKHHGVKGQKWGVRRGPPYPIEDTVLKKGTRLNSLSARYVTSDAYLKSGRPIYTYNPNDEWDKKVYLGPFAFYNAMYRGARFMRDHEFETINDLKMPTKKERMDEFKELYTNKKTNKVVRKDLKKYIKLLYEREAGSDPKENDYKDLDVDNLKTDEDWQRAYTVFSHAMEAPHANKSTTEYVKRMSGKYDAMVDDNHQGRYNDVHDPVIIFRAAQNLKDVSDPKSPHFLSFAEVQKNYDEVMQYYKKLHTE